MLQNFLDLLGLTTEQITQDPLTAVLASLFTLFLLCTFKDIIFLLFARK